MNRTPLTRRLIVGVAGLMVGGAAALALAAPAVAQDPVAPYTGEDEYAPKVEVSGTAECVDGQWEITWTVSNNFARPVTVEAVSAEVVGLAIGDTIDAGAAAEATQTLPGETLEATLTVKVKKGYKEKEASGTVLLGECKAEEPPPTSEPEPPAQTGDIFWEIDCVTITITITNTTDVEEQLTVVPSEGESVEVTVPAGTAEVPGESEPVSFPVFEGFSFDVQFEGESVVEGGPIEITSEVWADAGCPPSDDDGEGGELPKTGTSTMFIAGGAAALLALGGGLFLFARRRRVTFTA